MTTTHDRRIHSRTGQSRSWRHGRFRTRYVCVLMGIALIAGACGSSSESQSTSGAPTTTNASVPTSAATSGASTTQAPAPTDPATTVVTSEPEGVRPVPEPFEQRVPLRVGLPGITEGFSLLIAAKELGEFEKENIDVEFFVGANADNLAQLATGGLDVHGGVIAAASINALSRGLNVKGVAPLYSHSPGSGLYVRTDLLPVDPAALRDFSLGSAVGPGSATALPIAKWLATFGVAFNEVETVQIPTADVPTALRNGVVEGAFLNTPSWRSFVEDGSATLVASYEPGFNGFYLFGPNLLEDRRDIGEAFVRVLLRTQRTYFQPGYKEDADFVAQVASWLDVPPEAVATTPELVFDDEMTIDLPSVTEVQQVWIDYGDLVEIDAPLPLDQILDLDFIAEVLAD